MAWNPASQDFIKSFLKIFRHLSRAEASILDYVAERLPEAEQLAFRSQVKAADFQKHSHTILFSYTEPQKPMAQFADTLFAKLAVVTIKGRASGFTVLATVFLSRGVLHSLDFDRMPWMHCEELDIQGEINTTGDLPLATVQ